MDPFSLTKYFAKMKFFKLFGNEIKIYDESKNNMLFFVKQKAFKLKEDITIYSDSNKSQELLKIGARSILDLSATYDVMDPRSGQKYGSLRREGLKSVMVIDSWQILDANGQEIGKVQEDNWIMALIRRYTMGSFIPQTFQITVGNTPVGVLKQTWNPFVPQFYLDFSMDTGNKLDRRMGIAAVILMQVIEGKQQ